MPDGLSRDFQQPAEAAPEPSQVVSSAGLGESAASGRSYAAYIDNAVPMTMYRLRFDSGFDMNRPDRNEFFYAKCGCFNVPVVTDPRAAGPVTAAINPATGKTVGLANSNVDFYTLSNYLEVALDKQFSAFVNVPIRWIHPDATQNAGGLSDIDFGAKYAFIYTCNTVLSAQVRGYAPSGDSNLGLGTNHWTVEPSLLLWQKLSDRFYLQGQLSDWIPIGGSDFAGNIIEYGLALSFVAFDTGTFRVIPVVEALGWTCLEGQAFAAAPGGATGTVVNTSGETIVNGKFGIRFGFGRLNQPGLFSNSDLYVGYSRALTGDVWYRDMFRIEYRLRF
jgi:hypothetical protein